MNKSARFAEANAITKMTLALLFVFAGTCSAAFSQGLTMEDMLRMTGSNEPHLRALQAHGPQQSGFAGNSANQNGYDIDAAYSSVSSAGASGQYGNSTANQYYYANQDREQYDYEGSTSNQQPISRGGLPETTTAIQSQSGSFGQRFGATQIRSGRFTYGFSPARRQVFMGVSGNRMTKGRLLPPVSTASVEINTVDR